MPTAAEYAKNFTTSGENRLFLAPNIPRSKLYNALTSYGGRTQPEDVILLIDDTVFGGAAEGVILTRTHFVCKEIYKSPQTIELNAGDVFSAGKGFLKTFICLNGTELMSITQLKSETVYALLRQINFMLQGRFDRNTGAPCPSGISTAERVSDRTADEKPCPFCGERIKAVAIKCRFCGEMIEGSSRLPRKNDLPNPPPLSLCDRLLDPELYMNADRVGIALAGHDGQEIISVMEEMQARTLQGDENAGVAWAAMTMILFGNDIPSKQQVACGTLLGVAAAGGHPQAREIIAMLFQGAQNDGITHRAKLTLETILHTATQYCPLDECL